MEKQYTINNVAVTVVAPWGYQAPEGFLKGLFSNLVVNRDFPGSYLYEREEDIRVHGLRPYYEAGEEDGESQRYGRSEDPKRPAICNVNPPRIWKVLEVEVKIPFLTQEGMPGQVNISIKVQYDNYGPLVEKWIAKLHLNTEGRVIETTQYQNFKMVALLRGFGFDHIRSEYGDEFISQFPVEKIENCWAPGHAPSEGGNMYIIAFKFTTPDGYEDVLVWYENSSGSGQLFAPIALCSLEQWERVQKDWTPEGWKHFMKYHEVRLP